MSANAHSFIHEITFCTTAHIHARRTSIIYIVDIFTVFGIVHRESMVAIFAIG